MRHVMSLANLSNHYAIVDNVLLFNKLIKLDDAYCILYLCLSTSS